MINDYGLAFHHLGLAVRNKTPALHFLQGLGYQVGQQVYDPNQEVNLLFCHSAQQPDVEVIYPSDKPGPLDRILQAAPSQIYHICYASKDIEQSIALVKQSGLRVIPVASAKPAPLFNGSPVAFYQLKGFGLIEIVQQQANP